MPNTYLFESKRLGFRLIEPDQDLSKYYQWLHDREVTRYLENRFFPKSLSEIREYISEKNRNPICLLLGMHLKFDRDTWIGNIKLEPIEWIHSRGEIGIMIGEKSCWGERYGSEAIVALRNYAFDELGLMRLTAGCYAQNEGSEGAFRNAGFQVEGRYRNHIWCEGKFHDEILFGILKEDLSWT